MIPRTPEQATKHGVRRRLWRSQCYRRLECTIGASTSWADGFGYGRSSIQALALVLPTCNARYWPSRDGMAQYTVIFFGRQAMRARPWRSTFNSAFSSSPTEVIQRLLPSAAQSKAPIPVTSNPVKLMVNHFSPPPPRETRRIRGSSGPPVHLLMASVLPSGERLQL